MGTDKTDSDLTKPVVSKERINSMFSVEDFAVNMLMLQTKLKFKHWQMKGGVVTHRILDDTLSKVSEYTDKIVEQVQGFNGRVIADCSIKGDTNCDYLKLIDGAIVYLKQEKIKLKDQSIAATFDELIGDLYQLNLLLKNV